MQANLQCCGVDGTLSVGAEYVIGLQEPGETTGDDAFHELPNATE